VSDLPPGARSALRATIGFVRDPLGYYQHLRDRHGDPFTAYLGWIPMVVTGNPDGIRQIFSAPIDAFAPVDLDVAELVGPDSVVALEGDAHRVLRQQLNAPLLTQRADGAASVILDIARRHVARWPLGRPVRLQRLMGGISFEVILRAVYGMRDEARIAEFIAAFERLNRAASPLIVFFPRLRRDWGPWSPWGRLLRARRQLDRILLADIRAARARTRDPGRHDVLDHLVALTDPEGRPLLGDGAIRDNLLTLLNAGRESTAAAMAWSVYWIWRTPGVLDRLREELVRFAASGDPADLAGSAYLDAVCRETLRIQPIGPLVARKLAKPMALAGRSVPAGTMVAASVDLAHYDSGIFADPADFRPERFLGARYRPDEFLPFGGGRRYCLGAMLALEEMRLVVAVVVCGLDLRLAGRARLTRRFSGSIMAPRGGVRVVIERRRGV
jgi:cytochrome P450